MSKPMVAPSHASAMACRSEPAPLSAFVVTSGFVKHVNTVVSAGEALLSGLGSDVLVVTVAML